MAKRFTKPAINWSELEKRVPVDQKSKFMTFKAKSDAYLRRVQANPETPPKINWEEYKKSVPVAGLVDKFKSSYESLKISYPEDTLSVKIDQEWKILQGEIKKFCDEQQKDIDMAENELKRMRDLPKFDDMTMEMVYDMYPKEALNPVNKPTFWPHTEDEQPWYKHPESAGGKGGH